MVSLLGSQQGKMLSVFLKKFGDQGKVFDASTFGFKAGENAVRFSQKKNSRDNLRCFHFGVQSRGNAVDFCQRRSGKCLTLPLVGSKQGEMLSVFLVESF